MRKFKSSLISLVVIAILGFILYFALMVVADNYFKGDSESIPYAINAFEGRISVGGHVTAIIDDEANLLLWGSQISNGAYMSTESKQQFFGSEQIMENTRYVCLGENYGCAIDFDNNLWYWTEGEPKQFMQNVTMVSMGPGFGGAVKTDGTLWMWGNNDEYQLTTKVEKKLSSTSEPESPVQVLDNVVKVSCGENYTLALKNDGTVWGWGNNENNQITGASINTDDPVQVMSGIKDIASGTNFSAAVDKDSNLLLWGYLQSILNTFTEDGPVTDLDHPKNYMQDVAAVSNANGVFTVLKNDATVWSFGDNQYHLVGIDSQTGEKFKDSVFGYVVVNKPQQIAKDVSTLYTGGAKTDHCAVIKNDGSVLTWGSNDDGQLANENVDIESEQTPTEITTIVNLHPFNNLSIKQSDLDYLHKLLAIDSLLVGTFLYCLVLMIIFRKRKSDK